MPYTRRAKPLDLQILDGFVKDLHTFGFGFAHGFADLHISRLHGTRADRYYDICDHCGPLRIRLIFVVVVVFVLPWSKLDFDSANPLQI